MADINATAIKLITISCPSIISMTMMKEVMGAWVTAARNPAMHRAPIAVEATSVLKSGKRSFPIPAPIESEGANIPPVFHSNR